MRIVFAVLACCAASFAFAAEHPTPDAVLRTVFPRDVELELALSAAPAHLREGATVYVYGRAGYEKVRAGTNGLTCLLNRDGFFYGAKQFKPTCWDEIGEATSIVFEAGAGGAHGLSYIIAVPARPSANSAHEHESK